MKECVVVLGMHRSGTSVLTGLLSFFGGYVGADLMKPTKDNPKGYFENNKIYLLNEKILRENDTSWHDYNFNIKKIKKDQFDAYVSEAKAIIEDELKYVKKTLIKDPRISVLFPIWEKALLELGISIKVILAYRSPLEVAQSLLKRDDMAIEKGLMLWSRYFLQAERYSRNYERMVIQYNHDFLDIPVFLRRLGQFINEDVTDEILERSLDFYSPKLKHHDVSLDNIAGDLPYYLCRLIELLKKRRFDDKETLDEIRHEFNYSLKYYLYNQKQLDDEKKQLEQIIEGANQQNILLEEKLAAKKDDIEKYQQKIEEKEALLVARKKEIEKLLSDSYSKEKTLLEDIAKKEYDISQLRKGLDLLNSNTSSGDKLFNKLLANKGYYKKMRRNTHKPNHLLIPSKFLPILSKRKSRIIHERLSIIKSGLFSPFFYLTMYPDVRESGMDPVLHYCKYGWKEGRHPSKHFDTNVYLRSYPDVARANINPLAHYINNGKKEGRKIAEVVLFGDNVSEATKIKANRLAKASKQHGNLIGPVFEDRWKQSLTIISLLNKQKKLTNQIVPQEVLLHARRAVEKKSVNISVIMPTWNRANSILAAVNSVLGQSYLPKELIIVDDGSTDDTIDLLKKEYGKEISNGLIKILHNNHKGVSAARNAGLTASSGDYIAYLDSDNIWRNHYLLLMAAAFSENDELNCAYSALERFDNNNKGKNKILATNYDRKRLLDANFIDLNVFIHSRQLFDQLGGFDTKLKRLVDWDLIIRYTKNYMPAFIPFVGVDYYLDDKVLKNITTTVSLEDNRERIYKKHFQERIRYDLEELRLAYVLWDFPALSQTFVMEEIKWLVQNGNDVIVYYSINPDKEATLDFEVESFKVASPEELAELLIKHQRNFCHSHFAYPTVTRLTYPACTQVNIPFTFMPHAVDIFHHENKKRNKIGEISRHPLCEKVLVHGEFHKKFIEGCGVPGDKIAFNIQAVNIADFEKYKPKNTVATKNEGNCQRGIVITRFVEKKGLSTLFEAAAELKDENVIFEIYGYGPLEEDYKKQIAELNLDNVELKGALTSQQAVAEAYERSDFLIVPCVVAENGDMDGFPTVILEAMAAGLPVITTDVAAIPDYLTDGVEALVAPAGDIAQIKQRVKRLIDMSPQRNAAMIKRSQEFLGKKIGVEKTMQMLVDTWLGYTLDIFLVTYNPQNYDDRQETFEIIRRIYKYTTTPFTLTVIDNNSDEDFWSELINLLNNYSNIRIIRKRENQYCGPASNIALELSDSQYAIYICSKEGFIKKHGWERTLMEHMRSNPNDAIAGHHSQMPKYIYGKEYLKHPDFLKFRNPEFANKNPERVFKHVQGGTFILDRNFVYEHGGFNPATPHGGMDVEMSYYIESLGYGLGEIPEVASLTVKTRPRLPVILNERTVIAHPLSLNNVDEDLDSITKENGQRCNICGWKGRSFLIDSPKQKEVCPDCGSTGFARSLIKILANSTHIYRGENCAVLSSDRALTSGLHQFFKEVFVTSDSADFMNILTDYAGDMNCILIDPETIDETLKIELWDLSINKLSSKGELIFADASFVDESSINEASKYLNEDIQEICSKLDGQYSLEYVDFSSYCIGYDWRRFGKLCLH